MENNFRIEHIETTKCVVSIPPNGYIKVFKNTNESLPSVEIDVEKRFGIFSKQGEQYLEEIYNFEVRKDDVWVIGIPKTGTTWMCELVWLLQNDFDYETAKKVDQRERRRFLEYIAMNPKSNSIEGEKNLKSPRLLKSHLPIHMLPKGLWTVKPKIVYITRDPKDVAVSAHHFYKGLGFNASSVEVTVDAIVNDRMIFGPFWSHVAEFWQLRNEPYVYFTSFERMKKDLANEILKVSEILGKSVSNEQMNKLIHHLSFDQMKNNLSGQNLKGVAQFQKPNEVQDKPMGIFIRKGKVGSYKEELNNDSIKIMEDWTQMSTKTYGITLDEILFS